MGTALLNLDHRLFFLIFQPGAPPAVLDALVSALTTAGHWTWAWVAAWTVVVVVGGKRIRPVALTAGAVVLITNGAVCHLLQPLFARLRPFDALPGVVALFGEAAHVSASGFPSAHAANAFGAAVTLCFFIRSTAMRATALGVASVIAVSRVYIGVHFPADVAGGAVFGAAVAYGTILFIRTWTGEARGRAAIRRTLVLMLILGAVVTLAVFVRRADTPRPSAAQGTGDQPPHGAISPGLFPLATGARTSPAHPLPPTPPTAKDAHQGRPPEPGQDTVPRLTAPERQHPSSLPPPDTQPDDATRTQALRDRMRAHLDAGAQEDRFISMPTPPEDAAATQPAPPPVPDDPQARKRAEGRQERSHLPLAVVLWDGVPAHPGAFSSEVLYTLRTGDVVRVLGEGESGRRRIHPGANLFLAQISREIEAAGEQLPDRAGWVSADTLYVLDQAQETLFIETTEPITFGPDFSMLAFYERAMQNPDPVVHRVAGPRLIRLLSVHEDYSSAWGALFRDPDPKIRSVTLAALGERGIGHSRTIIEDLILRLSELTRVQATGETEAEVLAILGILRASGHPRVPIALSAFEGTWQRNQGERVVSTLRAILKGSSPDIGQ